MSRAILMLCLALLTGTASAANICRFAVVGSLDFANYDIFSTAPRDSQATVTVRCDRAGGERNLTITMRLGSGVYGSSASARRMLNVGVPGEYLAYGLYRDGGRSMVWGDTDGVNTQAVAVSVFNKDYDFADFTIYGRIPAGQNAAVGTYTDSVRVDIVF